MRLPTFRVVPTFWLLLYTLNPTTQRKLESLRALTKVNLLYKVSGLGLPIMSLGFSRAVECLQRFSLRPEMLN